MSTKTGNNIRLKVKKSNQQVIQKAPAAISGAVIETQEVKLEKKINAAQGQKIESFIKGHNSWEAKKLFSNKEKWDNFLKSTVINAGIFSKFEADNLRFKYDEKPQVFIRYNSIEFNKDISFRVWNKTKKKETTYDIDMNLNVKYVDEKSKQGNHYVHTKRGFETTATFMNFKKITADDLKNERKSPPKKNVPPEKELTQDTINNIQKFDKKFKDSNFSVKLESDPPQIWYSIYNTDSLLFKWIRDEVITNKDAKLNLTRVNVKSSDDSRTYEYILYQTHQKRKTERKLEVTLKYDPDENTAKPYFHKRVTIFVTGFSEIT